MTTQTVQIVTSPELIKLLGRKLYSLPLPTIVLRELVQNAIDASQSNQKVEITFNRDSTYINGNYDK